MKIITTKTTKITTSVNWSAALKNDSGVQFAVMTGAVDAARPLGTTALTVHNQAIFASLESEAKAAYQAFQNTVTAEAANISTQTSTEVNEDA